MRPFLDGPRFVLGRQYVRGGRRSGGWSDNRMRRGAAEMLRCSPSGGPAVVCLDRLAIAIDVQERSSDGQKP